MCWTEHQCILNNVDFSKRTIQCNLRQERVLHCATQTLLLTFKEPNSVLLLS